jgi:UDP-glucose 4-epimerase
MKVLVLGGNGFIGSHVVDGFLAAGWKVRVFDRAPELYRAPLANVDYRLGSFSDLPALAEALEGVDVVIHLISTTVPSTSNLDPIGDIEGNLVGTVRLLQLMVQKGCKRIVYLSSGGTVYGVPNILPISESHSLNPICSYGVVKVAVENYLFMYQSLSGINPIILRASNPYGERQTHSGVQGVIGTFFNKVKSAEEIEIWGDGNVVRDFIYVKDLAKLAVLVSTGPSFGVINAGSGVGHSIKEILTGIENAVGKPVRYKFSNGRAYDVPRVVLDVTKARDVMGWVPEVGLKEGLAATWSWMMSR